MRTSSLLIGKVLSFLLMFGMVLSACGSDLWGNYNSLLTPTTAASPTVTEVPSFSQVPSPLPTSTASPLPLLETNTPETFPTPTNTSALVSPTRMPDNAISYTSQSGDSLNVVARHFGVLASEIVSAVPLSAAGFINPGTLLFVPQNQSFGSTTPALNIIPDSELVDSPSAVGFSVQDYVNSAGGRLNTYTEWMLTVGTITGAEGVQRISTDSSISPRLLLALIQYFTGWVTGNSKPGLDEKYMFGYKNPANTTLYQQLRLVIQDLLTGYYGWRAGNLDHITFPDGSTLRIAPSLNAGSVALQYFFAKHYNQAEWLQALDPDNGFLALYKNMFGDPWQRANELGPLFPPNLNQPDFTFPFEVGAPWNFTYGPHPAWEAESALGALDFAPSGISGCGVSDAWVVAIAPGQIVRSEDSYVVLDLDGDGFEQTGWVVIYQHIGPKDRIAAGKWVNAGDRIGHPACEGGTFTGTNLHIARKYNGEWVAAGGPLPFVLSGWTAHAGSQVGEGTLTKDGQTITASQVSEYFSKIIRQPGE